MAATVGDFELLRGSSTPLLASGDVLRFVDISDTTQAPQGSLVSATVVTYFAAIPVPINITSASATAFAVGLTGATNPAFLVDCSTALQVAGLKVTGAVTGGTVAIVTTDSGAATNLTLNAKGTGTIGIGSVSTGRVTITPVTTITGALTLSAALTYGGVTLSNAVTGTGNMVLSASPTLTGTVTVTGATITGLTAASVATGTFPGVYTVTGALTLSAALTYGGVTLSNAVTGTGNMVLSASPTLSGTLTGSGPITGFTIATLVGNGATDSLLVLQSSLSAGVSFAGNSGAATGHIQGEKAGRGIAGSSNGDLAIFTNATNIQFSSDNGTTAHLKITATTGAFVFGSVALSGITTLSGSGAVSGFTTANFSGNVTVAVAAMAHTAILGSLAATDYGMLTLNGSTSATGMLGVAGGGGTDKVLYLQSPTGGGHTFNINNSAIASLTASLFTVSVATTAVQALTATSIALGDAQVIQWVNTNQQIQFNAGQFTVKTGGSVRLTLDGTTAAFGVGISATTGTFSGAVQAASFNTQSIAVGSVNNGATANVKDFTGAGNGTWLITIYSTGGAGAATGMALVTGPVGVGFFVQAINAGASWSWALSGNIVQLTNSSGASVTGLVATVLKIT